MEPIKFRPLQPRDIKIRVDQINERGVSLLLYKDARCDQRVLDEAVGPENWQREHYLVKDSIFCRVGINVTRDAANPVWVWKADNGAESYAQKEKGESSDSFKRACSCWGIGRELYSAPRIWVSANTSMGCNIKTNAKGKLVCYDEFTVTKIVSDGDLIMELEISNYGHCVFRWKREDDRVVLVNICDRCGENIKDVKAKDGTVWNAADILTYSHEKFGAALCPSCMKARSKELKQMDADE